MYEEIFHAFYSPLLCTLYCLCPLAKGGGWYGESTGSCPGAPAFSLLPLNLLLVLPLVSPQPQLRVLIVGHLSCLLCHRGAWHVDPSLPSQSTGRAEDSRDLQLTALQHQR